MELAAAGQDLGELDVTLLHSPYEVEDEVRIEEGCDESCVVIVHVDEQLVYKGDKGSPVLLGYQSKDSE